MIVIFTVIIHNMYLLFYVTCFSYLNFFIDIKFIYKITINTSMKFQIPDHDIPEQIMESKVSSVCVRNTCPHLNNNKMTLHRDHATE